MTTARAGMVSRRRSNVTYAVLAAALALTEVDTDSRLESDKLNRLVREVLEEHGASGVVARLAKLHSDPHYGTSRMVWALRTVRLNWPRLTL